MKVAEFYDSNDGIIIKNDCEDVLYSISAAEGIIRSDIGAHCIFNNEMIVSPERLLEIFKQIIDNIEYEQEKVKVMND